MAMLQELTMKEMDQVSGGLNSVGTVLLGTIALGVGGALTVAGLGTPISIAGGFLAAEGAEAMGLGFAGGSIVLVRPV